MFSSPLLAKVEGIVTKDHKHLLYIEDDYEALYDLKCDPNETKNLAVIQLLRMIAKHLG